MIGITANYSFDGSSEFAEGIGAREQEWQLIADDYISSVVRAGSIPVVLPVVRGADWKTVTDRLINCVDGVLFSGGSDVNPLLFGQKTTGRTGGVVPERDEQEIYMFRYLLERTGKPILGICRGIQIMNVALGGTLIQHIPDSGFTAHTLPMYPRQTPSHRVQVEAGTLLHDLVNTNELGVNSFHHMAVEIPAPSLKVTACSEDGVVEAVELKDNPSGRFFLGVQWHPEMMAWSVPLQQGIITAFVDSCRQAADGSVHKGNCKIAS